MQVRILLLCCSTFFFLQLPAQVPDPDWGGYDILSGSSGLGHDIPTHDLFIHFEQGTSPTAINNLKVQLGAIEIFNATNVGIRYWNIPAFPVYFNNVEMNNIIEIQNNVSGSSSSIGINDIGFNYKVSLGYDKDASDISGNFSNPYDALPNCDKSILCNTPTNTRSLKIGVVDTGVSDALVSNIPLSHSPILDGHNDTNGHGTKMASIISKTLERQNINNANIVSIKALDGGGKGQLSDIIRAIDRAIEEDIDILNLSFGYSSHSNDSNADFLLIAIQAAIDANMLIITSAGNNGRNLTSETVGNRIYNPLGSMPFYPASLSVDGLLTVGASNCDESITDFSNYGEEVDVFIPGVEVLCMHKDGSWKLGSGTSHAAALTTAVAAQLANQQAEFDAEVIACSLKRTFKVLESEDEGPFYFDMNFILNNLATCSTFINPHSVDINYTIEDKTMLYDSYPNPSKGGSMYIPLNIPNEVEEARLEVFNLMGQLVGTYLIREREDSELQIETSILSRGTYFYSLIIDNKRHSTKKFMILK